ncbi:accessory gene regulator ArgB-like protein [Lysinibacillus endophyticus]|uniref:accessory gene regulator ArgB-like protein n=1 Tax=Ureibacillus endophyticus TaxID=1978490 RepID=UPI00313644A4
MFSFLNQENFSPLEKEKLRFGIQIVLAEINKLLIIYLVAFLLDCFVPTLITHLSFLLLRQVCLGYHFKNLYICIAWSLIAFPIAINFLTNQFGNLSAIFLYIGFCILLLFIYILAPQGTENQPIISEKHRSYLRKQMNIRLFILIGVFCFSPEEMKVLISYGVFLEVFMLITQKIKGEKLV